MAGNRQRRHIGDNAAEDTLDRGRLAIPDRVGQDDRIRAGLRDLDGDIAYPVLVDPTLDRAAESGGETASDARSPLLWRSACTR